MTKWVLIFCLILISCSDNQVNKISNENNNQSFSTSSLDYLYAKLEGKRYPYKPGKYYRNKTIAFFVDKENGVYTNVLVNSIMADHNILAKDSINLKTVVLIYGYKLPLNRLIDQEITKDENGYHICFVDIDSMCIRKIVSLSNIRNLPNYIELIGKAITDNF